MATNVALGNTRYQHLQRGIDMTPVNEHSWSGLIWRDVVTSGYGTGGAAGFGGVALVDLWPCVANDLKLVLLEGLFGGGDMAVLACRFEGRVRVL